MYVKYWSINKLSDKNQYFKDFLSRMTTCHNLDYLLYKEMLGLK